MIELTQVQQDALARAKAREGRTNQKPWEWMEGDATVWSCGNAVIQSDFRDGTLLAKPADKELITDSPELQDLAIAQADIIAQQAARIAELEARLRTPIGVDENDIALLKMQAKNNWRFHGEHGYGCAFIDPTDGGMGIRWDEARYNAEAAMPKEVAFWVAYGKNASNEPQYFYSWEKPE